MKKVIAFAGSNSKESINKQLAEFAANQVQGAEVEVLDLNDYQLPIYGIDYETEQGIPQNAHAFIDKVKSADGIVLSLAEHNGVYAAVFKNLFDWISRIDGKPWSDVPMLLMATSPGARGGATVLEIAKGRFPYNGGNIIADFSLPSFFENFSEEGIKNEELNSQLKKAVESFQDAI